MTDTVNSYGRQHHAKSIPHGKDWKRLNLSGRKAYSSAALQFRIANRKALVAKYDHTNYGKLSAVIDYLSNKQKGQFQAIIGQLKARTALQAALYAVDTVALLNVNSGGDETGYMVTPFGATEGSTDNH